MVRNVKLYNVKQYIQRIAFISRSIMNGAMGYILIKLYLIKKTPLASL